MEELIDKAIQIWFDGGSPENVWNTLNHLYSNFGDPTDVHVAVLDGAHAAIRALMT
jgi:hypothetical protein